MQPTIDEPNNVNELDRIEVFGAREHNLQNIDVSIPRNQLVVFTGLSGSGKSSLAFDTIFAEGQRRYLETFSAYARQFLGGLERPDVDKIDGLSPVISIEQKTVSRSPRSTVGTITEIYDFLRLLYARAGTAFSYETNEEMVKYSDEQIVDLITEAYDGKKVVFLAPKVKGRKGHYRELFEQIQRQGFTKVRVDGVLQEITKGMKLDRYKIHDIEMVVDRLLIDSKDRKRIYESVVTAMKHGSKAMMIMEFDSDKVRHFSRSLMCPSSGISYPDPEPNLFSFNSPYGACPTCSGLGEVTEADLDKIIPNTSLSVKKGALAPLGEYKKSWIFDKIDSFLQFHEYSINTPLSDITEDVLQVLLYGNEDMEHRGKAPVFKYEGLINFITRHSEESSAGVQRWAQSFMNKKLCPECLGTRLRKEAHFIRIGNKHIGDLASMDLSELAVWFNSIENHFTHAQLQIATEILKEIRSRLSFMLDVGLNYLTLHRSARSLSGGEAQRIRLATQIGSELLNVIYVLDEPSIGLHQRDNTRLIRSLQKLRDTGNSVIVVEHDKEMIESADWVVEIGPGAGKHGGKIIQVAKPDLLNDSNSSTAAYLRGIKSIEIPKKRRKGNGNFIELKGAIGHNLKNVDISIPLGTFTCVTGVSGSGKSSLITNTLLPILMHYVYDSVKKPLEYKSVHGLEHIDKVIEIDQSPIGRTPRSNPATYTKVFDEIRLLFSSLPEAQIRGYKPGRFSFNVAGGKCETCNGGGLKQIEMNFLPDVYVECDTCQGKRYNRETLEVRFKGKSISDVLNMTVEEAVPFFESIPKISRVIQTLYSVGLGYITLGQPSTTLSGGEAQRIKLASELAKKSTGKTIYLLDEPSTGLHFEDIRMLLDVLQRLVNEGNTVLVIEHNLDVVKVADYVIDLGPEGGKFGGEIIGKGTPEELVKKFKDKSHTAKYLEQELHLHPIK
jgi:excinuclease ABC subunit A